jgi:hypothetical protein
LVCSGNFHAPVGVFCGGIELFVEGEELFEELEGGVVLAVLVGLVGAADQVVAGGQQLFARRRLVRLLGGHSWLVGRLGRSRPGRGEQDETQ